MESEGAEENGPFEHFDDFDKILNDQFEEIPEITDDGIEQLEEWTLAETPIPIVHKDRLWKVSKCEVYLIIY